ncbi:MAG: hypothetical protein R3E54_04470 [Halioglobus sp.]
MTALQVAAEPSPGLLNERLPASNAEREAHWQVDCTSTWGNVLAAADEQNCAAGDALRRELRLCAFIYQPPGEASDQECPDYQGAWEAIGSDAALLDAHCEQLRTFLAGLGRCAQQQ